MAKLVYTDGGTEHEFVLDPGRAAYTIGRNPMCDLRINNPSISRKHAEIRVDPASGRFAIFDLNSSNGTYVNGKRAAELELENGDELLCGEFKILFVDSTRAAPSAVASAPTTETGAAPHRLPPRVTNGNLDGPPRGQTIAGRPAELFRQSGTGNHAATADSGPEAPSGSTIPYRDPAPHDPRSGPDPAAMRTIRAKSIEIDQPRELANVESAIFDDAEEIIIGEVDVLSESELNLDAQSIPPVPPAPPHDTSAHPDLSRPSESARPLDDDPVSRELKATRAELKSLRLALQNESARAAEAVQERSKRNRELQEAKAELETTRERLRELEQTLERRADADRDRQSAVAERDERVAAKDAQIAELQVLLAKKTSEVDAAESVSSEAQQLRADVRKRAAEVDAARVEIEKRDARVRELEGEAEKLRGKNEAMKAAFQELSAELKTLIEANERLSAQGSDSDAG